jgi:uncharacterized membrane protein SpoIIM required for sporulation
VDIDRYIARNQPSWDRLDDLTCRARRRMATLAPGELDELIALYQRTSAQLSYVRTYYREPALSARLTRLVASANGVIYGKRTRSWRVFTDFFTVSFPAAVWHQRRPVIAATLLFVVPAALIGLWLVSDPVALDASGHPLERQQYVDEQFEQYYSDRPSAQFFTEVTTNNIRVGFLAFALGALLCLPGAFILVLNAVNLGVVASWMIAEGDALRFWGLILPHGALEITAIVVAGGAGLALGWAVVAPGDRTRGEALADEGRRAVVIVLGLMATFTVAGLIEGFVTGSALPPAMRVAIGLVAWAAFVTYIWVLGRDAAARGFTGALGERDRPPEESAGQSRPTALTRR